MTTYKELFGKYVQNYASDPTSTDAEGQIWYNSTSGTFKTALGSFGVFSSGGNLNTARSGAVGSGTQTVALAFGGYSIPTGSLNSTELYNGTSWTSNPTGLGTARGQLAGAGIQTSSLAFGGNNSPDGSTTTETWNGSSWTSSPAMNTARYQHAGCGAASSSALAISGRVAGPTSTTATESYNGTAWTTNPGSVNTGRWSAGATGTQTAALFIAGQPGPAVTTATESYNGTSWTTVNSINTAREGMGAFGNQTASVIAGGSNNVPAGVNSTEVWNGTSWTSNPTGLATTRFSLVNGAGTRSAGLVIGGTLPSGPQTSATEEWDFGVVVPVAGSWSSGGSLNTARNTRGAGTQTATIAMGGNPQNVTESYNGTSWTTLPATMATARNQIAAVGTQTSALAIGGYDSGPGARLANTEVWDGTSYSSGGALGTGVSDMGGSGNGTATAALVFGGAATPGQTNITQSYNGSAWTTVPATLSAPNATMGGLGVQTAALVFGGQNPSYTAVTQSYNGTSWTTVNSLNTARGENIGGAGTQTAGLAFGGSPPNTGLTELWNGTSWTVMNTMATGRFNIGGSGTQSAALGFGGNTPTAQSATEEWTGPSTTLNYKTLTTS